jgi:hypothetical protein
VRGLPPAGIPRLFRPRRDPVAREFAHWRAWTLTDFLRELRDAMRRADPRVALLTNTFGAVNVDTYHLFGVDLPELAHVVDWLFVENLQSPRAALQPSRRRRNGVLVQNAGTFKLLQALKPAAPALSISYDRGIGVDAAPEPRVFERTAAEAYAAGGVPVLRAGEYVENGAWTLLQPGRDDPRLTAARGIGAFVAAHPELFAERRSAATVAVYVPPALGWRGEMLPRDGMDFLAVIQALVASAIPFRVVTSLAGLHGIRALIVPAGTSPPAMFHGLVLAYRDLGIRARPRSLLEYLGRSLEPLLRRIGPLVVDGYFSRVHVRRFIDRLNLVFRLVFRSQFMPMALSPRAATLLRALQTCVVLPDGPVYADLWQTDAGLQLHLVNYGDEPAGVLVASPFGPAERVVTPEGDAAHAADGRLRLRSYAVLEWPSARLAGPFTPVAEGESVR